jgi:hypothetical protein
MTHSRFKRAREALWRGVSRKWGDRVANTFVK